MLDDRESARPCGGRGRAARKSRPGPADPASSRRATAPPARQPRGRVKRLRVVAGVARRSWRSAAEPGSATHWWTTGRFLVCDRRRLCPAPERRRSPPRCPGYVAAVAVDDNAAGQGRRRDRHASTTATTACAADGARQDRDAGGDHRPHRPADRRRSRPPSTRRRRSSPRPRPARRAPTSSSKRQQDAGATADSPASQRSSRRRPIATRRDAAVQAPRPRSKRRRPTSTCSRRSRRRPSARCEQLQTALAKAERDLSFTVIRAPFDGVVGNRAVQVGDYVQPGTAARQPGAARRRLCRRQLQGDAARRAAARARRCRSRSTPSRPRASTARSRASRRPPARCSACCRPTTPPATSPRSCSACRCASACRPTSPSRPAAPGHVGGRQRRHQAGAPSRRGRRRAPPCAERQRRHGRQRPPWPRQQRRATAHAAGRRAAERIEPRRLVAFLAMVFGMFMAILDIQIVSASLAEIQAGLSASRRRDLLGADRLSDRRSDHDPAVGLPVARAVARACCSPSRPAASRPRACCAASRPRSTR